MTEDSQKCQILPQCCSVSRGSVKQLSRPFLAPTSVGEQLGGYENASVAVVRLDSTTSLVAKALWSSSMKVLLRGLQIQGQLMNQTHSTKVFSSWGLYCLTRFVVLCQNSMADPRLPG